VVADSAEEPLLPGQILLRPIQAASPRRNGFTSALGQKIDWQEAQESRPKETLLLYFAMLTDSQKAFLKICE
jgi:hypothetical protein